MSERKRPLPEHEGGSRAARPARANRTNQPNRANRANQPGQTWPRRGDRVSWRSHGGTAHGTVQEVITGRTEAAGRTVAASPEEPQYRVRTDEGRDAVHKPEALRPEQR